MASPTLFPQFPQFPYEIRRMIWESSFEEPRRICLTRETVPLTPQFQPRFLQLSNLRTNSSAERYYPVTRSPTQEYTSFLTCPDIAPVQALQVCHESREIALSKYRPWKMFNRQLKYRTIMWHPDRDIVDLTKANDSISGVPFVKALSIFERQFPGEIVEVKSLAVLSSIWGPQESKNINVIWPLIDFLSLKTFIVVLDTDVERTYGNPESTSPPQYPSQPSADQLNAFPVVPAFLLAPPLPAVIPWSIPEDVEEHIDLLREHYTRFGPEYMPLREKPTVRFVEEERDIVGDKRMHGIIRCHPFKLFN